MEGGVREEGETEKREGARKEGEERRRGEGWGWKKGRK